MATNAGQDEQEAGGQDQEHHNDDEQRDTEAGGMSGLGVERKYPIPQSHDTGLQKAEVGTGLVGVQRWQPGSLLDRAPRGCEDWLQGYWNPDLAPRNCSGRPS